ncbi:MAG: cysteine--tRNA ligase, partial [Candidatus Omnitrophica bacterium]|nr:cysteine--tRNA ligase [Candidatus Omnitrophota bacterium]
KAKEKFRTEDLKEGVKKVAGKYLRSYHEDMERLDILKPTKEPKATEYINRMHKFIQILIKRKVAYESGGDVYFDIKKAKGYGKLSNQKIEKMEVGARIEPGENKKYPLDFALWKKAKTGEPAWDSPWGPGRPGWHIECSVMSSDILGEKFDIHAGGIDLIFPHHENEIAQSEGAGYEFAKTWMHNGLLTINGEKMSKSLGNFITIKNFTKNIDLLKLLFLSSHYRNPVDYNEEKIAQVKSSRDRILAFLQRADAVLEGYKKRAPESEKYFTPFKEAMDDDFNTPLAISVIFKCVDDGNKILEKTDLSEKDKVEVACDRLFIRNVAKDIFGLNLDYRTSDMAVEAIIEAMISEREEARKNKDFKKADELRSKLLREGIIIEDTKEGTVWRRKS